MVYFNPIDQLTDMTSNQRLQQLEDLNETEAIFAEVLDLTVKADLIPEKQALKLLNTVIESTNQLQKEIAISFDIDEGKLPEQAWRNFSTVDIGTEEKTNKLPYLFTEAANDLKTATEDLNAQNSLQNEEKLFFKELRKDLRKIKKLRNRAKNYCEKIEQREIKATLKIDENALKPVDQEKLIENVIENGIENLNELFKVLRILLSRFVKLFESLENQEEEMLQLINRAEGQNYSLKELKDIIKTGQSDQLDLEEFAQLLSITSELENNIKQFKDELTNVEAKIQTLEARHAQKK